MKGKEDCKQPRRDHGITRLWSSRRSKALLVLAGVVLGLSVALFNFPQGDACLPYYTNSSLDARFAGTGRHGTSWEDAYVFGPATYQGGMLQYGLAFRDTSRYIIIRNAVFINISRWDGAYGAAISFDGGKYLRIENCTFLGNENGIVIKDSREIFIVNSSIMTSEGVGLRMMNTKMASITQNIFSRNAIGIEIIGGGDDSQVSLNNFTANTLHASDSSGGTVNYTAGGLGNFWDNYWGINPAATVNLSRPVFISSRPYIDGVVFMASLTYPISAGTADAAPLVYFPDVTPTITITEPLSGQVCGNLVPHYNVTLIGPLLENAWVTIDGANNRSIAGPGTFPLMGEKSLTGVLDPSTWASLEGGPHVIAISAQNWFGRVGQENVSIVLDLVSPIITILEPLGAEVFGSIPPHFNLSIQENHLKFVRYSVNGSSPVTEPTITGIGTIDSLRWNFLGDGNVTLTFWAEDRAGNTGSASIIVLRSTTAPQLVIASPIAGGTFSTIPPLIDITIIDLAPVNLSCQVGLDPIKHLLGNGPRVIASVPSDAWNAQPDGFVEIKLCATDVLGNANSTSILVQKDQAAPVVHLNFAEPALAGDSSPEFCYSAFDPHLNPELYYTIDNGSEHYGLIASEFTATINDTAWGGLTDGNHTITLFAWDNCTPANTGSAWAIIKKDASPPLIAIHTRGNFTFGARPPTIEVEINDRHLASIWYEIDGDIAQYPIGITNRFPGTGTISLDAAAYFLLPDGAHGVTIWASDTLGHVTCTPTWWFKKDGCGPRILGTTPARGAIVGPVAPEITILAQDENLVNWAGYSLDGGNTIQWFPVGCVTGNVAQTLWDRIFIPGASIQLVLYANDTLGNQNSIMITVYCEHPLSFFTSKWFAVFLLVAATGLFLGTWVTMKRVKQLARSKNSTKLSRAKV